MYENSYPKERYNKTLHLINKFIKSSEPILDLGVKNPFSEILTDNGYTVFNTKGEDLDLKPEVVKQYDIEVVTALEILEHFVSPMPLLQQLPGKKLIATVPLNLWFAKAYKNSNDKRDRHYHEFEDWQFDWLLEKSGWKILYREKWKAPTKEWLGVRPILRKFTPRYYAVYAERE